MPQPIRNIHIKADPHSLVERPQLASRIAIISSLWTDIEDQLAIFFGAAIKTHPAVAAAVLGRVANLSARLDMIETAFALTFPEKVAAEFKRRWRPQLRKRAGERASVIHCHWTVHEDYPDHLIRIRGLSDPQLEISAYDLKDFLQVEIRLLELHLGLKEFGQSLAPYILSPEPEHVKSFWQPTEPHPDQPAPESPPDQKSDPE